MLHVNILTLSQVFDNTEAIREATPQALRKRPVAWLETSRNQVVHAAKRAFPAEPLSQIA